MNKYFAIDLNNEENKRENSKKEKTKRKVLLLDKVI